MFAMNGWRDMILYIMKHFPLVNERTEKQFVHDKVYLLNSIEKLFIAKITSDCIVFS